MPRNPVMRPWQFSQSVSATGRSTHPAKKKKRERRLGRSGGNRSDTYVPHHVSNHVTSRLLRTFDPHDRIASMMAYPISIVEHFLKFSLEPASRDSFAMPSAESAINVRTLEPESTIAVEE